MKAPNPEVDITIIAHNLCETAAPAIADAVPGNATHLALQVEGGAPNDRAAVQVGLRHLANTGGEGAPDPDSIAAAKRSAEPGSMNSKHVACAAAVVRLLWGRGEPLHIRLIGLSDIQDAQVHSDQRSALHRLNCAIRAYGSERELRELSGGYGIAAAIATVTMSDILTGQVASAHASAARQYGTAHTTAICTPTQSMGMPDLVKSNLTSEYVALAGAEAAPLQGYLQLCRAIARGEVATVQTERRLVCSVLKAHFTGLYATTHQSGTRVPYHESGWPSGPTIARVVERMPAETIKELLHEVDVAHTAHPVIQDHLPFVLLEAYNSAVSSQLQAQQE